MNFERFIPQFTFQDYFISFNLTALLLLMAVLMVVGYFIQVAFTTRKYMILDLQEMNRAFLKEKMALIEQSKSVTDDYKRIKQDNNTLYYNNAVLKEHFNKLREKISQLEQQLSLEKEQEEKISELTRSREGMKIIIERKKHEVNGLVDTIDFITTNFEMLDRNNKPFTKDRLLQIAKRRAKKHRQKAAESVEN